MPRPDPSTLPLSDLEQRFRDRDPAITEAMIGAARARQIRAEESAEDAARRKAKDAAINQVVREILDYESPTPRITELVSTARETLDEIVVALQDHAEATRGFKRRLVEWRVPQEAGTASVQGRTLRCVEPMEVLERLLADTQARHRLERTHVRHPADHPAVSTSLANLDRT